MARTTPAQKPRGAQRRTCSFGLTVIRRWARTSNRLGVPPFGCQVRRPRYLYHKSSRGIRICTRWNWRGNMYPFLKKHSSARHEKKGQHAGGFAFTDAAVDFRRMMTGWLREKTRAVLDPAAFWIR